MNNIYFYEEFSNKRKNISEGNVIAVLYGNGPNGFVMYDAIVGAYSIPNSPVTSSTVDLGYISKKCKRISKARAKEIHPNLFMLLT